MELKIFRIFIVTDKKVAILKDKDEQFYKTEPPYKKCEKISYNTYFHMIHSSADRGTVYPESGSKFRSLEEIQKELVNN